MLRGNRQTYPSGNDDSRRACWQCRVARTGIVRHFMLRVRPRIDAVLLVFATVLLAVDVRSESTTTPTTTTTAAPQAGHGGARGDEDATNALLLEQTVTNPSSTWRARLIDTLGCHPYQVHIAYGENLNEVVVVWSTLESCSAKVSYGTSEWTFDHTKVGTSLMFTGHHTGGLPFLHRVKLEGLTPSTTYFYQPLSYNISAGPFYFKTPPAGNAWSPELLVYGDLGIHTKSIPVLTQEALTGKYAAVLHIGDFAYNLKDEEGRVGDLFMSLMEEMSSHLPYMTSPGNHEIDHNSFDNYRYRFSMPGSDWPIPLNKMWYSFNVGPIHFISYSSEVFFATPEYVDAQHDWLIEDLRQANTRRDQQPWVIAFGHRPMYCSNNDSDDCTYEHSKVRAGLEDIFYQMRVDVVLQAHEHSYERLWPVYRGVVLAKNYSNPRGPVQIITGAAGSKHGVDYMKKTPPEDWSAFRMENTALNSYGVLRVLNATHLYWEQRSVHDHEVLDSIWITQTNHGPNRHEELPVNISNKIKEAIEHSNRPPENINLIKSDSNLDSQKVSLWEGDRTRRIVIGASFGGLAAAVLLIALVVQVCRRRHRRSRRWDRMDMHYGKKLYQPAQDLEQDLDNDFEIDMNDGTLPTSKLLNN